MPVNDRDSRISFSAEKWTPGTYKQYWQMGQTTGFLTDVRRQLHVPQCIVETVMRPGMVFYNECKHIVYFIE